MRDPGKLSNSMKWTSLEYNKLMKEDKVYHPKMCPFGIKFTLS